MANININATSFYWNSTVKNRMQENGENIDLLNNNSNFLCKLRGIINDVDLTQRQKANILSQEIETYTKGDLEVILAILNTQEPYFRDVFTYETPFTFIFEGKATSFSYMSLNKYTTVLNINGNDSFIPLDQYTSVELVKQVLKGSVEFEDLTDAWMSVNDQETDKDFSVTILALDGWHPTSAFQNHSFWIDHLNTDFSKLYSAFEQQTIVKEFLETHKVSVYEDGFTMDKSDDDFNQSEFEDAIKDAITQVPSYLNYYTLIDWLKFLVDKVNARQDQSKRVFKLRTWTGYSQGESGVILYMYNPQEILNFEDSIDDTTEYHTAIARGDDYYKHIVESK